MQRPNRIRAAEAAQRLGVSLRAVQQTALRGEIPGAAKIGHLWTFCPAKLGEWVEGLEEKNAPRPKPVRFAPNPRGDRRLPEATIHARYEQLIMQGRRKPRKK